MCCVFSLLSRYGEKTEHSMERAHNAICNWVGKWSRWKMMQTGIIQLSLTRNLVYMWVLIPSLRRVVFVSEDPLRKAVAFMSPLGSLTEYMLKRVFGDSRLRKRCLNLDQTCDTRLLPFSAWVSFGLALIIPGTSAVHQQRYIYISKLEKLLPCIRYSSKNKHCQRAWAGQPCLQPCLEPFSPYDEDESFGALR